MLHEKPLDSYDCMTEVASTPAEINDRSRTPPSGGTDNSDYKWDEVDEELETALMRMKYDLFPPKPGECSVIEFLLILQLRW